MIKIIMKITSIFMKIRTFPYKDKLKNVNWTTVTAVVTTLALVGMTYTQSLLYKQVDEQQTHIYELEDNVAKIIREVKRVHGLSIYTLSRMENRDKVLGRFLKSGSKRVIGDLMRLEQSTAYSKAHVEELQREIRKLIKENKRLSRNQRMLYDKLRAIDDFIGE